MIYTLGAALHTFNAPGCFERYDPTSDLWQILSDPPLPSSHWLGSNFVDRATVVGRRVFISSLKPIIFNLDTLEWDPLPSQQLALRFPFGSIFVNHTACLYYLRGPGSCKPGSLRPSTGSLCDPLQAVKRGPLTTTATDNSFFMDPSLLPGNQQLLADASDLDDNIFFTESAYFPSRDLFHMGGRFFCYLVTAPLFDNGDDTIRQPNSRGVWIKFFEEVPTHTHNCIRDNNNTKFQPLASFCYKIDTNFSHLSSFIRCSVLGTVPDSWINAPLEKRQESKLKHINEVFHQVDTITQHQSLVMKTKRHGYKAEQWRCELVDNTQNREMQVLKNILAVREEENSRLADELARKTELLKSYEALLDNSGGMNVNAYKIFSDFNDKR
ncbi:hypothetical protein RND81_04G135800 [Saponaria officinalis]|uniref:Uncharacterized protein n=1 Tax=Saponaria officinalis TaxID=3572 RepID=A0AAW1LLS1_SAPOF